MNRIFASILTICLLLFATGCADQPQTQTPSSEAPAASKTTLTVSAAASLTDALNECKQAYEQEHSTVSVTYIFGSSGKLAQQIEQGAPTDLFLSASAKDMDTLQQKQLIAADTRTTFAKNELALIIPADSKLTLTSFEDLRDAPLSHLAIGEPKIVPAGRYANEVLTKLNLLNQWKDKLVYGSDVRQVLTYVESGNADAGIVYTSDAAISPKVKIVAISKPEWHQPIVYPAAVIAGSAHAAEAKAFIDFLVSDKGQSILKKYGFQ